MPLTQQQKAEIRAEYGANEADSGSTAVQIAQLSKRIAGLTEHMKANKHDFACRRGLLMLVGRRRRLLKYYRNKYSVEKYQELINQLGLRK